MNDIKWVLRLLFSLVVINHAYSQNLVNNGDFEQAKNNPCRFISDPQQENLSNYFLNWISPTGGTSDPWFYSDTLDIGSTPTNPCTQNLKSLPSSAHSGLRCAGIYTSANTYKSPTRERVYREYLQTKLVRPLQTGKNYYVELYCRRNPYSGTNTNNIGFYFSINPVRLPSTFTNAGVLQVMPQVNYSPVIQADTDWLKISGCFTATNSFVYLTIGNFNNDLTTTFSQAPLPNRDERPYYLIDDVVVKKMTEAQLPIANFLGPDTTLCPQQSLLLPLQPLNGVIYYWSDGSLVTNPLLTQPGTYHVQAIVGGCILEDSIQIAVERELHLPPDTTLCLDERIILTLPQTKTKYEWSTGSVDSTITVSQSGLYWVKSSSYCHLSDTIRVELVDCRLFIPNVITPNGDGKNDQFVVQTHSEIRYQWSLEIVNRWGQTIYRSDSYRNDWAADGSPAGVYYYLLGDLTHRRQYKGWITVIR